MTVATVKRTFVDAGGAASRDHLRSRQRVKLWVYEIDNKQSTERSKVEMREKVHWFLKYADITTIADDIVE